MCAEPVRNVRSDGGGYGRSSSNKVLMWVLVGVVAAVLAVGGFCGVGIWRMGKQLEDFQAEAMRIQAEQETNRKARTVVVSAADLLKEFQDDAEAADEKYAGKYLELSGVVERNGRGRFDTPFVVVYAGDEQAKLRIECFFDALMPQDEALVKRLRKGQKITVGGEYDGQVTNIQLRDCVLVKDAMPAGGAEEAKKGAEH
jgi:hypothetical protein